VILARFWRELFSSVFVENLIGESLALGCLRESPKRSFDEVR
jgi:hypothetical protein